VPLVPMLPPAPPRLPDGSDPASILEQVAARHDLSFGLEAPEMFFVAVGPVGKATGTLGGGLVRLEALQLRRPRKHHATEHLSQFNAELPFDRPLGEGLRVEPYGSFEHLAQAQHVGFSRRFSVGATHRERGASLLSAAGAHLDAAFDTAGRVWVDDAGVYANLARHLPGYTVDELDGVLQHLVAARSAVVAAAAALPVRPEIAPAAAALARAARPGARLSTVPVALEHDVGGATVVVSVNAGRKGLYVHLAVTWPAPLPGNPQVVAESSFGWWDRMNAALGNRYEIRTGDAAFDKRFAVRSSAARTLVEALDAPTRAALLDLDRVVPARLGAAGVKASGSVRDGDLEAAVAAAYALADRFSRSD
jgi:hypothetical protein